MFNWLRSGWRSRRLSSTQQRFEILRRVSTRRPARPLRFESLENRHLLAGLTTFGEPPPPRDDVYTLDSSLTLEIDANYGVLHNDRLPGRQDLSVELVDPPVAGELTLEADGSFAYLAGVNFNGSDSFTYRMADSNRENNLATVTIGSAEALSDVIRYRLEIVDVAGNAVSTAAVGQLLELRAYVEMIDPGEIGIVLAVFDVDSEGETAAEFESPVFDGDGYRALSIHQTPSGLDDVGVLFPPHWESVDGESLVMRALFTAQEPGFASLAVAAPSTVEDAPYRPFSVYLREGAGGDPLSVQFLSDGQIDFGEAVSVQFEASDQVPPEVVDDTYTADRFSELVVDAASGVLANDSGAEATPLTARLVQGPPSGEVSLNPDGSFQYVHQYDHFGPNTFYYLAENEAMSQLGKVTIALTPDEPPTPGPSWQNPRNRFDVDADQLISQADEDMLQADLQRDGERELPAPTTDAGPPPYLDVNGDGWVSDADVEALRDELREDLVHIRLQAADLTGSPITSIGAGEEFLLQAYVADQRGDAQGVFSAYADITFDAAMVSVSGDLVFGSGFPSAQSADLEQPGRLDEVGAIRGLLTSGDAIESLLFQVPVTAVSTGQVTFFSEPADERVHEVTVFGRPVAVPSEQIRYGEVIIDVGEINGNAPQTSDDLYAVDEDRALDVDALAGVLANDQDVDADALRAVLVSEPRHGSVTLRDDGSFLFQPEADYAGQVRFTYRATDGNLVSSVTTVTINVQGSDDAPKTLPDTYSARVDRPLRVAAGQGVLSNDREVDGQAMTAEVVDFPRHGVVELKPSGALVYIPDAGFEGTDTFVYRASDGLLASPDETVSIQVRSIDDSAIVLIDVQAVDADGNPIGEVQVGDSFLLQVTVEDLRQNPEGVFAAYMDVEFDPSLVAWDGTLLFDGLYSSGISGEGTQAGLIDEAGAFTSSVKPIGGGTYLLFSAPLTATAVGEVSFVGNPADLSPAHDVLVYGLDTPVPDDQTQIGQTSITNVPAEQVVFQAASLAVVPREQFAQDDTWTVRGRPVVETIDVLANDREEDLVITDVSGVGDEGTFTISDDGRKILYEPAEDYLGVSQIEYTAQNKGGATSRATVEILVRSRHQNPKNRFDTDTDGHVAPLDALVGINQLNEKGSRKLTPADENIGEILSYLDVNGDGMHTPADILETVNQLNAKLLGQAEGEQSPPDPTDTLYVARDGMEPVTRATDGRVETASPDTEDQQRVYPPLSRRDSSDSSHTADRSVEPLEFDDDADELDELGSDLSAD